MDRTYFIWWQSPYGPEMRRFDSAGEMMHFIIGWSMLPNVIYPEPWNLDRAGFQLSIGE